MQFLQKMCKDISLAVLVDQIQTSYNFFRSKQRNEEISFEQHLLQIHQLAPTILQNKHLQAQRARPRMHT